MAEFVVPPSAVSCAIAILKPRFPGVKVASKAPATIPSKFVRVTRSGGNSDWAIDSPLLMVQFWAPDEVEAEVMALTGAAALNAAQGGTFGGAFVHGWGDAGGAERTSSIMYFPDPDTNRDRYQLTGLLSISKIAA